MALIEAELPNLRRYARAATGCRENGDALADLAIAGGATDRDGAPGRVTLYKALDTLISRAPSGPGTSIAARPHRALLLSELEGFSNAEIAVITSVEGGEVSELIDVARNEAMAARPTEVFIVEDEPLIAAHIAEITRQMGHTVIGTAATAEAARRACRAHPPGLLLSDVMLGEEPAGADAAREISAEFGIPVVYVTAFPQALLKGKPGEPTYLLKKPFKSAAVKAMIGQAILRRENASAA